MVDWTWQIVLPLASLASSLSDDLLAKATVEVVQNLRNKSSKSEMTRTNIQMIGALRLALWYAFFCWFAWLSSGAHTWAKKSGAHDFTGNVVSHGLQVSDFSLRYRVMCLWSRDNLLLVTSLILWCAVVLLDIVLDPIFLTLSQC